MSVASCRFWHQIFVWNESHCRSRILTALKIFSGCITVAGTFVDLIHVNMHDFRSVLGWWIIIGNFLMILNLLSLLDKILSAQGQSIFKLFLHLFKIYKLIFIRLNCIIIQMLHILVIHVVLDRSPSFIVELSILHWFTTHEICRSAWCRECSWALTSVHLREVSQIWR